MKESLPESLLIDGHNPMSLIYNALSKGVHEMSDEECLKKAMAIRIVLFEFAQRLSEAVKDHNEFKKALGELLPK